MPAHIKGFVGRERRTKIMARGFQLNGPIRKQNQRYLLGFRNIGTDGVPMRICARTSESLHRFGLNRFLSHGPVRRQPSAKSNSTSRRCQTLEEISPGQTSRWCFHGATSVVQTINSSSESVNLRSSINCVARVSTHHDRVPHTSCLYV